MEPVDKKYNFLKPIKTPNLIRFGGKLDGGYVVDLEIVKKCNNLITLGLGPNWSFELDYLSKNKKNKVHIYDHKVSSYPYIKAIGKYFRRLITFRTTFEGFTTRVKNFYNFKKFLYSKDINFFKECIAYPIKKKIEGFNIECLEINGHNFEEIFRSLKKLDNCKKFSCILANTIKGKGSSVMENKKKQIEHYLKIIDEIEKLRTKNNVNWMDILRIAFKHSPEESRQLWAEYDEDELGI